MRVAQTILSVAWPERYVEQLEYTDKIVCVTLLDVVIKQLYILLLK